MSQFLALKKFSVLVSLSQFQFGIEIVEIERTKGAIMDENPKKEWNPMRDDYNNPNFNAYANQGFKGGNLKSSGGDYLINQAQNPTYELHISRIPPGMCVQNFRMVLNSDPLISITSLVYLKIKGSLWYSAPVWISRVDIIY